MKRLYNDTISPYLTLPSGVTVTLGGSTMVLNEEILEDPYIQKLKEDKKIRVEDDQHTTGIA